MIYLRGAVLHIIPLLASQQSWMPQTSRFSYTTWVNTQCRRKWGKPVQITEARKGSRGPYMLHMFFVFLCSIIICRLYKLTLSDYAQVTLQVSQSFRYSVMIFRRSAPAGGARKKFFHRGPNPLSATLLTRDNASRVLKTYLRSIRRVLTKVLGCVCGSTENHVSRLCWTVGSCSENFYLTQTTAMVKLVWQ
jgi:hypothetical protein